MRKNEVGRLWGWKCRRKRTAGISIHDMCPRDVHVCACIINPQENPYLSNEHPTARVCLVHCVCRFASIKIPVVVHLHQSLLDRLDLPNKCMYVSSAASENSPQRRDPGPAVPSPNIASSSVDILHAGPSAVRILPLTILPNVYILVHV